MQQHLQSNLPKIILLNALMKRCLSLLVTQLVMVFILVVNLLKVPVQLQ
ncbi:Uncharacterised protein [Mycobacteroides abscessus subsp. massiliense]|nr:Uncharacterised protein [Mycobacteroides abscessus subsp. massiliense]